LSDAERDYCEQEEKLGPAGSQSHSPTIPIDAGLRELSPSWELPPGSKEVSWCELRPSASPMTPVSRNVLANLVGKLSTGLLTLGLIPVYVKFMGVESYGLVGLFATFQTMLLVLDMGLSVTLNRELARITGVPGIAGEARDLVRTLEVPYWIATGVVLIASWPLGSLIATYWIRTEYLTFESVRNAMVLMGLAVALQFPFGLYSGGLMGLQRQVLLNCIMVATAVLRGLGATLVLWLIDPSIQAFVAWQLVVAALQTLVTRRLLWGSLPSAERTPHFRMELLVGKGHFAGGIVAITTTSIILTQSDKIILSKILTLQQFGYYAMASVAAGALSGVVSPLYSAVFPRFSQLVAGGDLAMLKHLYHKSCQTMAVLILPPTVVMVIFSREIMLLWTQDATAAMQTCRLASLLVVGTALNGLMHIPYALQLANGWTKLTLGVNVAAIFLLIPLLVVLSLRWGALGAAWVWPILNAGYVLIALQLMHRRLLRGELWRWYWADFALPLVAVLGVSALVRLLAPELGTLFKQVTVIAIAGLLSLLAAGLTSAYVRKMVLSLLSRGKVLEVS